MYYNVCVDRIPYNKTELCNPWMPTKDRMNIAFFFFFFNTNMYTRIENIDNFYSSSGVTKIFPYTSD